MMPVFDNVSHLEYATGGKKIIDRHVMVPEYLFRTEIPDIALNAGYSAVSERNDLFFCMVFLWKRLSVMPYWI